MQFIVLHVTAIFFHLFCFTYTFFSPQRDVGIPISIKTVIYNDTSSYYANDRLWEFTIPSVVVLHGMVAGITLCFHTLLYLPSHLHFSSLIWNQQFFTVRWVEYAFTCTLMSIASMISSGTDDLLTLVSAVFYGIALQAIGCSIEQTKKQYKFLFFIGLLIQTGLSSSAMWYVISSRSMVNSTQILEFLFYAFYYSLFPLNCIYDARYRKNDFIKTDWIYNLLSLSSKFGLYWLQVGELEDKFSSGVWPKLQIYGLGITVPIFVLIIGMRYLPKKQEFTDRQEVNLSPYMQYVRRTITFRVLQENTKIVPKKIRSRSRINS
jgi:hypothetical protein